MKIVKLTKNYYLDFEKKHTHSIFQSLSWLESVASNNYTLVYLGVYDNDKLIAVCPFVKRGLPFFCVVGSPMKGVYSEFGGPIFDIEINHAKALEIVCDLLQYILKRYRPMYFQFSLDKFSTDYEFLNRSIKNTYSQLNCKNSTSALIKTNSSIDEAWSSVTGRARTAVRKAKKNGVIVKDTPFTRENISLYYDLYSSTFSRRGLKPRHSRSFYEEMLSNKHKNPLFMRFAYSDSEVVSAAIFLIDRGRVIYLSGVSTGLGLKLSAQSLVLWNCIEDCTEKCLDFDVGGYGDTGIDKFKLSFSGEQYSKETFQYVNPIFAYFIKKIFKIVL
jgi:lipid II:glycine glycyltransferase (peptidoglycan interpeptide bridge formation enzyme)